MRNQVVHHVQVKESHPGAVAAVVGRQVANEGDVLALTFPVPEPVSIQNGDASVTFVPVEAPKGHVPPAHGRVVEKLFPAIPRPHALGRAAYDAHGHARRLGAIAGVLAELNALEVDEKAAPHVAGSVAEVLVGGLGLSIRDCSHVVEILSSKLGIDDATVRAEFERVVSGATAYEFDSWGRALDEQAAREEEERERARAATVAAQAAADEPNEATAGELNAHAFRFLKSVPEDSLPKPFAAFIARHRDALLEDDDYFYLLVDKATSTLGAALRPRALAFEFAILPDDAIPPGSKRRAREAVAHATRETNAITGARALRNWMIRDLRSKASRAPILGQWDLSTAEGRARFEQWKGTFEAAELVDEIVRARMRATDASDAFELILSSGRDGFGLASDLIAADVADMLAAAWKAAHEPMRISHEENEAQREAASKKGELFDVDAHGERHLYTARRWSAPAIPIVFSEKAIFTRVKACAALFDADELFMRPPPGVLGRIAAAIGADPYKPAIEQFVEGREEIRSAEIEETIGDSTPQGRSRIFRVMTKLGFTKTKVQRDGVRFNVFRRTAA